MRRMTLLVTALALVLGLAQCKKEQMPTNNPTEGISITLDVNDGDNGNSKVIVNPTGNPNFATVSFETGDTIYVGNGGQYRGFLIYDGSKFVGTISGTDFNDEDYLHFYFLGGLGFKPTIDGNTATVSISNQTEKYPVISYAHSTDLFTMDNKNYRAKLQNKVSIMKFNVDTPSSSAICITGMNNKVSVDFETPNGDDNGFSYSQANGGLITMHSKDTEGTTWAIVLPQTVVEAGEAYTDDGSYMCSRPAIEGGITSNQYYNNGIDLPLNTEASTPLTLEALTAGTIVVNKPKSGMKYSLNGGAKTEVTSDAIPVSIGDKVRFFGNGTSNTDYNCTKIAGGTARVKVYGNIMSLMDETDYATLTTQVTRINAFRELFKDNTMLTDAGDLLLPATKLATSCYREMFSGCTSLTAAPSLPATTLANYCYLGMFFSCTSLTTAPALPATTMNNECYVGMFNSCTSLIAAPSLPATTLASRCYQSMFYGCTSLIAVPELPATTLAEYCYYGMFSDCTSLKATPDLPATTLFSNCYAHMFEGCTSLTAAPSLPATTLASICYQNMFLGCTSLTAAPSLPATMLASCCYSSMFEGCTNLTAAPDLPATTLVWACYSSMFSGCTSLTAAPSLPATTLAKECYSRMFYGCTSLTAAPSLPATTLAQQCYSRMFYGCTSLSSIKCLAVSGINENSSTEYWVNGVAPTGTFTKASDATWPTGNSGIPSGWTVMDAAQ